MWVLQALGALVLVVVGLLAVPVDVRCRADSEAAEKWSVRVGWLFGLVRIRRASACADDGTTRGEPESSPRGEPEAPATGGPEPPPRVERAPAKPPPEAPASGKRTRAPARSRGMPAILRSPAFVRRSLRLVRALLRRIRFSRFAASLRVGLDDPADTGQLMGILLPAAIVVRPRLPGPLTVLPAFDGVVLEGRAEADMRVVPLRLIGPLVAFGAWTALHLWAPRRPRP